MRSTPLTVVAPFERGRQFGGSQRITCLAERLEERGIGVEWRESPRRDIGRIGQVASLARGIPDAVTRTGAVGLMPARGPVLVAHSYTADAREVLRPGIAPRVIVDFVDLEWRSMRDRARAVGSPLRGAYLRFQSRLMRRHERALARGVGMRTFVQESEREWAIGEGADPEATLLIPNRLPHAAVAEAEAIHASRESSAKEPLLVYVGKLDHWPNFLALLRFLDSSWARIKAEFPQARLSAIGRVHDDTARALARYPDVACLGFVPDVTEHLAPARAAILPFYASMGSSLRVLFYALAGLPVVGSPLAFRGFPELEGTVARDDWVGAVGRVLTTDEAQLAEEAARLRATALELQRDDGPWDRLAAGVSDLISRET